MKRLILTTTSVLICIISIGWFISQPGYDSLIGILASVAGIVSSSSSDSSNSRKTSDLDSTPAKKVSSKTKKVSPFLFVATVLCFSLPFITVSCTGSGQLEKTTYSGIQITIDGIKNFSNSNTTDTSTEVSSAQSLVAVTFLLAIIGGVTSFSSNKIGKIFSVLIGATGGILLFRSKLLVESLRDQYTDFRFEIGFWLVLAFFLLAAVVYLPLSFDDA